MPKALPQIGDQLAMPAPVATLEPVTRADMAQWGKPPKIVVTTPDAPPEPTSGRLQIRELPDELMVECVVAPRRTVWVRGREYSGGAVIMLPASRAHQLRRVGDLLPADGPRDAA